MGVVCEDLVPILVAVFLLFVLTVNAVIYTSYSLGAIALARGLIRGSPYVDLWLCVYADHVFTERGCIYTGPLGLALLLVVPTLLADALHISPLALCGVAMVFTGVLAIYFSYSLYRELGGSREEALFVSVVNGLCGPLWVYSVHVFPQAPLAFLYALFLYTLLKLLDTARAIYGAVLGLLASAMILLDPSMAITICVLLLIALYYALRGCGRWSARRVALVAILFLASALPLATAQLLYNLIVTSNPLTFPEMLWLRRIGVEGLGFNPLQIPYGLYILFIDLRKGLIPLYPIYILALMYMPKALKGMKRESKAVWLVAITMPILVYASWQDVDGGLSYGPRFLAPITLLMAYPLTHIAKSKSRVTKATLITLAMFSLAENLLVVTTTPYPAPLEELKPFENQFLSSELRHFAEGFRASLIYKELEEALNPGLATVLALVIPIALAIAIFMSVTKKLLKAHST
jgi:hypothetical protein